MDGMTRERAARVVSLALLALEPLFAVLSVFRELSGRPSATIESLALPLACVGFAIGARAHRVAYGGERALRFDARAASAIAMAWCVPLGVALARLHAQPPHGAGVAWFFVPTLVAVVTLLARPRVGLASIALWSFVASPLGWFTLGTEPPVALWALDGLTPQATPSSWLALALTVGGAISRREVRLPLTWALAGLALATACSAIAIDLTRASDWMPAEGWRVAQTFTAPRLLVAGAMLIASRHALRDRTWAMLALVATCFAFAALGAIAPPGFTYFRWCTGGQPMHPLDADHGRLALVIATGLSLTWLLPVVRALRAPRA